MSAAEPSAAELMRAIESLRVDVRDLKNGLEEGYVRKDVQLAHDAASGIQLKGFEDELHHVGKRVDAVNGRIDELKSQRDRERDERDKQRAADRRLIYTLAVTTILGPVLVAWILHALGAK